MIEHSLKLRKDTVELDRYIQESDYDFFEWIGKLLKVRDDWQRTRAMLLVNFGELGRVVEGIINADMRLDQMVMNVCYWYEEKRGGDENVS